MSETNVPKLADHLTYEDTGYEYPWNYERMWNHLAPRIYYTNDHIAGLKAWVARRNEDRSTRGAGGKFTGSAEVEK